MVGIRLSLRLDLTDSDSIGPGKIALLEAIRAEGSIAAAARHLGMSYRRAWLLVESINNGLSEPAVTAATGGRAVEVRRSLQSASRSSNFIERSKTVPGPRQTASFAPLAS
jgi:molybdenum-dependent DNA-binding transcriptional regulator ModE